MKYCVHNPNGGFPLIEGYVWGVPDHGDGTGIFDNLEKNN